MARNVGGTGDDEVTSVTVTNLGIIVTGRTTSADMDFSKFKNAGKSDSFVMILNSEGKTTYTESFGGSADDAILDGTFKESKAGKTAEAFYASFRLSAE